MLAQNGSQAADLSSESGTDVLRIIRDEPLYTAHDAVEERRPVHKGTEARNLTSNGRPDLGLIILEKLHEGRNQIS